MISIVVLAMALVQDSAPAPRLELSEAYRMAAVRSPRIAAAEALGRAALARVKPSRTLPDPQVQLGVMNYALPRLRPMEQLGMTQLQVMQMLPTAGKLGLAGDIASTQADAARERARNTRWDVRSSVAMAFYDVYVANRSLSIERETLRLLRDILGTAESMYRVGQGRQADVLRAQVEIARMTQDTLRMIAMRDAATARLGALLDTSPPIARPVLPAFPDAVPALDQLIETGLRERPMILASERELEASHKGEKLARREIWPDLTVGVQYGQRGGSMGVERMGSLMLGASIPVFAKSRQYAMRQEAAAMESMARADVATMRADTRAAMTEAHADLTRARALAAMYRNTILPQAEAAAASALAAYRVGGVDFMTLLDDRVSVYRYAVELVSAEAEEGTAWAEIEMLLGAELFVAHSNSAVTQRTSP